MSKPIFLLCPGAAKSSTTFLSDVLVKSRYFNCGYAKECSYLDFVYYGKNNLPKFYIGHPKYLEEITKGHHYFYEDLDEFLKNYTIENYCNYYLNVYSQTKPRRGVLDFSQSYNLLPDSFLQEVKNKLQPHFDIKCILLFRDPIKRLYSFCNMLYPNNARETFLENTMLNTFEFSKNYYQYVIEKFENLFPIGDIFICSMEELYSEEKFSQLKIFLGIQNLEFNINAINKYNTFSHPYKERLLDKDIIFAKKKLYNNYKYWKFRYGYLPTGWYEI